jgi:hypothetical protein
MLACLLLLNFYYSPLTTEWDQFNRLHVESADTWVFFSSRNPCTKDLSGYLNLLPPSQIKDTLAMHLQNYLYQYLAIPYSNVH